MTEHRFFDLKQVMVRYQYGARSTVFRLVRRKLFPAPMKLGGKLLWRDDQLEKYEAKLLTEAEAA